MYISFPDSMSVFTLEFQKQRDRLNLFHFTMRLRPKFEALRSSILHRLHYPASLKQWLSSHLRRYVFRYCHHYLLHFCQNSHPQLLQHRIILLLLEGHFFVGHLFVSKRIEDNNLVDPQLNNFNTSIANNLAT